jgi:hypothetical protein
MSKAPYDKLEAFLNRLRQAEMRADEQTRTADLLPAQRLTANFAFTAFSEVHTHAPTTQPYNQCGPTVSLAFVPSAILMAYNSSPACSCLLYEITCSWGYPRSCR